MAVFDAETLLREAVQHRLTELVADRDLKVVYHVSSLSKLVWCEGEGNDEGEDGGHYYEQDCWKLHLHIVIDGVRYLVLQSLLPYEACADGDTEPMLELLQRMWRDFEFGSLMVNQNIDQQLEEVAAEVEGPGAG